MIVTSILVFMVYASIVPFNSPFCNGRFPEFLDFFQKNDGDIQKLACPYSRLHLTKTGAFLYNGSILFEEEPSYGI